MEQWLSVQLYSKDLPGKPDIVFRGRKKVIFVYGCFWHKHDCKLFKWPETNVEFWRDKISGNVARDKRNYKTLTESGWGCLIVWGCETKGNDFDSLWVKLTKFLDSSNQIA